MAGDQASSGEFVGFLQWIPSPYQGGWEGSICMEACVSTSGCPAKPMGAAEECTQQCYKVRVVRCRWAMQGEDSLIEIAPRFQTNWLQLWYLNPFMAHPDHASELTPAGAQEAAVMQAGEQLEINIGRIYTPAWDDTVLIIVQSWESVCVGTRCMLVCLMRDQFSLVRC